MTVPRSLATFRIGDTVTVRVDGSPDEVAVVRQQIGPQSPDHGGDADITIRFVDRLASSGPVRFMGLDDAAFTDRDFLILRGRLKSRTRAAIPLDRAGEPLEIVCERGLRAVPLLVPLVNLAALGHGVVPIHGSVFVHSGRGVLVVGWSKGGKTETVLAFTSRGAAFVGDEWVYLHPDGTAVGLAEPIRLWDWQLAQVPELRAQVGRATVARLAAVRASADSVRAARRLPLIRRSAAGSVLDRTEPILRRQLSVQVAPDRAFDSVLPAARVDVVVLALSTADPRAAAVPADRAEVAGRIAQSNAHERLDFMAAYRKFRFAFPGRESAVVAAVDDRERALIEARLANVPVVRLEHPYPPRLDELFDVLNAALGGLPAGRGSA